MADKYFVYIVAEMDRRWFHQVILFSEPTPPFVPKHVQKGVPVSESLSCSSSILSLPPLPGDETSTDKSQVVSLSSDSIFVPHQMRSIDKKEETKERKARMNLVANRNRSHSSSPSSQNNHRKLRKQTSSKRNLEKSMTCRTHSELELDEVKGFMDLGFIFKRENLSPKMMSVVPGLQRFALHQNKQNTKITKEIVSESVRGDDVEAEDEEKRDIMIMRPYLSEAWLIKRPDSPLLNLKIPKPCSASNMKKHLLYWAKTVASEICQE